MSNEIEAKFLAPDAGMVDAISRRRQAGGFRLAGGRTRTLRTVYLDTEDRRLEAARVALRVRKSGRQVEATVKREGRVRGDVHERPEWNVPLEHLPRFPWRRLPETLRRRLPKEVRDGSFLPRFETRVRRTTMLCHAPGRKRAIAEISLDRVFFRLPGRAEEGDGGCEVEVELLPGGRRDELEEIARTLAAEHGLRRSRLSKLERALRWARRVSGRKAARSRSRT